MDAEVLAVSDTILDPTPKRKRGRPKGSKNKPKILLEPVVGKPRADFQCETCKEMYVLPVSAKACPDPDCGGAVTRIWAGSPPGTRSAATALVDRVVGDEVAVAKRQLAYRPEFATKTNNSVGSAMGMVGPDGRAAARGNWVGHSDYGLLGGLGGPKPNWAR